MNYEREPDLGKYEAMARAGCGVDAAMERVPQGVFYRADMVNKALAEMSGMLDRLEKLLDPVLAQSIDKTPSVRGSGVVSTDECSEQSAIGRKLEAATNGLAVMTRRIQVLCDRLRL